MSTVILFLIVGVVVIYLIARYEKQNSKKVDDILRANKNVPPLFMLRSAELKVNAIKAALSSPDFATSNDNDFKAVSEQFERLLEDYHSREITLSYYYSKLGAILIKVNELKGETAEVEIS